MSRTTLQKADRSFDWYVVDASQHVLGHLAVAIAETLMGKRRPDYTPHVFSGDAVVVLNAAKVQTTGMKHERRMYSFYSGWVGGRKEVSLGELREHDPRRLITLAVRRMLPKNQLAQTMIKRLKVYEGADHPHAAQSPKPLVVDQKRRHRKG